MPSRKPGRLKVTMMLFRRFLVLSALFSLFFGAALVWAIEVSDVTVDFPLSEVLNRQESEGQADPEDGSIVMGKSRAWRPSWEDDWFSYRQGVLRGNFQSAGKSLEKVIAYRKDQGIPNLYLPSTALIVEGALARRQGRFEDALDLNAYARELAPQTPAPYFQKARMIWSQNKFRGLSALDAMLEGAGVFFRDFRSFFPWGLGLLLWLLMGLAVGSILTVLLISLRVAPRIAHDLSHIIKIPHWLWFLAFLVLLLGVLLSGLPFTLWVILIAFLAILHLSPKERIAVGIALALMASVPAFLHVLALGRDYFSYSRPIVIYEAEKGGEGPLGIEKLHEFRVRNPEDTEVLAAMALVVKRSGSLRESESLLRQAMELSPYSPRYLNNLGNIFMGTGRIELAIDHYRQALRYQDDPRIHYNLSQALRENLQLEEGEREFRIAQETAPGLTGVLLESQEATGERMTVDIHRPLGDTVLDALSPTLEALDFRDRLWAGIVPGLPFIGSWLLFLGGSAIVFLGRLAGDKVSVAQNCRKCACLHCPKCGKVTADILCPQCRQIFIVRSGVDPAGRVRKMMQIMRFTRRRGLVSRFATVLLPGLGHVYLGAGWQSLAMITLSTLFWTKWIFWHGFFRNTTTLQIEASLLSRVFFGVLLVAFYLFALKKIGDRLEGS